MKKRIIDSKIWKTGNSYVVTIPRKIINKSKIREGDEVEITITLDEQK